MLHILTQSLPSFMEESFSRTKKGKHKARGLYYVINMGWLVGLKIRPRIFSVNRLLRSCGRKKALSPPPFAYCDSSKDAIQNPILGQYRKSVKSLTYRRKLQFWRAVAHILRSKGISPKSLPKILTIWTCPEYCHNPKSNIGAIQKITDLSMKIAILARGRTYFAL